MTYRLFDIGGSGVKTCLVNSIDIKEIDETTLEVTHFDNPDWANFTNWAMYNNLLDAEIIGISCAGFIEAEKRVKLFRVGGWHNKDLVSEIIKIRPNAKVYLLNDAEAHLMAHYSLYDFPQMSICLGTSLGFAISDKNGNIVRSLAEINFDTGELALSTRASNNRVWWALGSSGLSELQNNLGAVKGIEQYGYRLGAFLDSICSIFQPKSVIFSGGITEKLWSNFNQTMIREFEHSKPDWLEQPNFYNSSFGRKSALIGMAIYIALKTNQLCSKEKVTMPKIVGIFLSLNLLKFKLTKSIFHHFRD